MAERDDGFADSGARACGRAGALTGNLPIKRQLISAGENPHLAEQLKGSRMTGTRISEDLTITGNLHCRGPVEVWGRIDGDVVAARLAIMSGGRVEGNIEADELLVHGEHKGTATCSNVEIFEAAVVHSTLTAKSLSCESGATICGKLQVVGEAPQSRSAQPRPRSEPAEVA